MPTELFESTGGIDPDAFSADLFPSDPPSGDSAHSEESPAAVSSQGHVPPAGSSTTPATPAAAGAAADAGMSQAQYDALPKSWKKEMEAEWKTASPALRKYAHEREQQVTEGITRYRQGSDRWNQVTSPFEAIIAEYPDVNVAEILSTLASNHIQMIKASPAERRTHAMALARGYGVDLTPQQAQAVVDGAAQAAPSTPQVDGFSPGQLAQLERTFGPVLATVKQNSAFVQKQLEDSANAEVDKFFSDPKNEFVNDVANDILSIIKKGQATSLPEAYELAIMRNPEVKGRYLQSLALKATPPAANLPKLPNVKSSATPIRPAKAGSIDDTIDGVIKKHFG